mmetsp:Transcript_107704/g.229943  ORF Transcript_107704/g.229943 Transcript_107704/m.229943 type:complete len:360 (+) Transcript_107704:306-1385(+)
MQRCRGGTAWHRTRWHARRICLGSLRRQDLARSLCVTEVAHLKRGRMALVQGLERHCVPVSQLDHAPLCHFPSVDPRTICRHIFDEEQLGLVSGLLQQLQHRMLFRHLVARHHEVAVYSLLASKSHRGNRRRYFELLRHVHLLPVRVHAPDLEDGTTDARFLRLHWRSLRQRSLQHRRPNDSGGGGCLHLGFHYPFLGAGVQGKRRHARMGATPQIVQVAGCTHHSTRVLPSRQARVDEIAERKQLEHGPRREAAAETNEELHRGLCRLAAPSQLRAFDLAKQARKLMPMRVGRQAIRVPRRRHSARPTRRQLQRYTVEVRLLVPQLLDLVQVRLGAGVHDASPRHNGAAASEGHPLPL